MALAHTQSFPLRIGKSVRRPTHRSSLSLKFQYVPPHADLSQPGLVRRDGNRCQLNLRTKTGQPMSFTGSRPSRSNPKLKDYVLVLVDGVMWLERNSDLFYGIRGGVVNNNADMSTEPQIDDPVADPDSWMADDDGGSSPITPENDEIEAAPVPPRETMARKSVAGKGLSRSSYMPEEEVEVEEASSDEDSGSDSDSSGSSSSSAHSGDSSDESSEDED